MYRRVPMNHFFCADNSRCLDEMPIGTARQYLTYILIECPTPWAGSADESQGIPAILSQTMRAIPQCGFCSSIGIALSFWAADR
jgi:hypothetical protein